MDNLLENLLAAFIELIESGEQIPDELFQEMTQLLQEDLQGSAQPATPPGADLLWILSGGKPEAFTKYLSTVPDQVLNSIATNPARVQSLINQLSQKVTLPAGEVSEGVPHADLNSSNIYGFQYDPRSKLLRVKFQGDGIYEYGGVPPQIFKAFQQGAVPAKTSGRNQYGSWWQGKQPSLGASFYELIRDRFPYQKVS